MKCQVQEKCYFCKDIASYKIFDEWEQKFIRMINETLEPKDRPPLKAFEEFIGVTWSMSHEDYCIASNGTHSRKDFYKEKGYTIFEYDDYFEVKQETIDRNTTPLI